MYYMEWKKTADMQLTTKRSEMRKTRRRTEPEDGIGGNITRNPDKTN